MKRGVWEAGGVPFEFPVMSLGETSVRPTAMLFRNLASMDVEESIRANPIDGVVLLCGCDKTTPSLIMGAASCDLPALVSRAARCSTASSAAPTSARAPTSGASARKCAAGTMSLKEFMQAESCMSRSTGTCNVMGTASTMASMAEALGLTLPDNAAIPAVDSRRYAQAHLAGRRIVELVKDDVRISQILTRAGVRERHPRERRDRRIDQRGAPPAGDRRAGRRAGSRCRTGTISAAPSRRSST